MPPHELPVLPDRVPELSAGSHPPPGFTDSLAACSYPMERLLRWTKKGNEAAFWIFQAAEDLTLESSSRIVLINNAEAKNIFWQIAGPAGAIIGPDAHAEGSILALNAITMDRGASLEGRALAQTVTLTANTITAPEPGAALPGS